MSTVNQEVTIKIDDSFTGPVCDYNVGFLKFRQQGKIEVADPMGTGTFVKHGKLYGILTAAHVLQEFGLEETVGLVRFPSIQPALQNRRLNLGHTKRVMDWNGKECDAPDIAFVSIPEVDGRDLEAKGAIFYNLGLARDFKPGRQPHEHLLCARRRRRQMDRRRLDRLHQGKENRHRRALWRCEVRAAIPGSRKGSRRD
jgi:hypothetical protein